MVERKTGTGEAAESAKDTRARNLRLRLSRAHDGGFVQIWLRGWKGDVLVCSSIL